ncbi:MAG: glycosyltransferase [Verrucomicrobiales bacterium]|nr:glycosyltransferase [Verrucomicrobiales bacterium]
MKITVLSHNLSSNASMRAHRLALAARAFAEVQVVGPVEKGGLWPALPEESWIRTVPEGRFPRFYRSFLELIQLCQGSDVLIAVKPQLASYGAALVASEKLDIPVILDVDDLDTGFAPRAEWAAKPSMADLSRPGSAVFVSLLSRAGGAASAVTSASRSLQKRFGGTLIPHGSDTERFNPPMIDRSSVRREFGFSGPTVLFAGTPRWHKGLKPLAKAVGSVAGATLAVLCRPADLAEKSWSKYPIQRLSPIPYHDLPRLLAAADLVAVPQLDTEVTRYQMPMKIYDCMAMGKPIVASAVSDLPEVLEGCGMLVPPGESEALAAAIRNLLENPALSAELGRKARERCLDNFTIGHLSERLRGVVEAVVRRGA